MLLLEGFLGIIDILTIPHTAIANWFNRTWPKGSEGPEIFLPLMVLVIWLLAAPAIFILGLIFVGHPDVFSPCVSWPTLLAGVVLSIGELRAICNLPS